MSRQLFLIILIPSTLLASCAVPPASPFSDSSNSSISSESSGSSESSAFSASSPYPLTDLAIPWSLAFLPDGDLLVTERPGTLVRLGENGQRHAIAGVHHRGEGGLLGIALHPDFAVNDWLYLYLTTAEDGGTVNRVERYRYTGDALTERTVILDGIPGAVYHDGGALAFGPDGYLYVTTGDATREQLAQDRDSLAGKILRIGDNGSVPADNPFGTAVYSYGHRNPQGIAWDAAGNLWATEHGRSGVRSGFDELNRIVPGGNYGWPAMQGDETADGMIAPALHSGPTTTWAPASAAFLGGSIWFGGLRGEALYQAILPDAGDAQPDLRVHLQEVYGRIRAVAAGPDGMLYLTTSNTDGRGRQRPGDDRVVRVDPAGL